MLEMWRIGVVCHRKFRSPFLKGLSDTKCYIIDFIFFNESFDKYF